MTQEELNSLRLEYLEARQKLAVAQKYRKPEPVENYVFQSPNGSVDLATLFGSQSELFVIHSMGKSCTYCTLWGDGLNGILNHLKDRAAIALSSPDPVEIQQQFAQDRNWNFTMVSTATNQFAEDMGYRNKSGSHPGVSVFTKNKDNINRVADTPFGPGDDFCAAWHLFDLLPKGPNGWQPQLSYTKN